jgi:hypothetical protein
MSLYRWVFLLHLASVFGFLMTHGVSAAASFKLRKDRSEDSARTLVELSTTSLYFTYAFLLAIIGTGVLLGFLGGWWRQVWIWAALLVVLALVVAMGLLAGGYHGSRKALGIGYFKPSNPTAPRDPAALRTSLEKARPGRLAIIGVAGLIILLWLMVFKPF